MKKKVSRFIRDFLKLDLKLEAAGGILLMLAMVLAIICANTGLAGLYDLVFQSYIHGHSVATWINDGPMAVFFFLVGLELKREFLRGELSDRKKVMLPVIGAAGGMLAPALIYTLFNYGDSVAMRGWAVPTATDIAFSLGVLALLGPRVPTSLRVFLTSLAIFDDLGAVLIIAFFYTAEISFIALAVAAGCAAVLWLLNRKDVATKLPYILVGLVMWFATLKSGVHATVAGVVLAMFIPLTSRRRPGFSLLKSLERNLHSFVVFIILPVFAFANSGINLAGVGMAHLLHTVPLGIALGLFIGKQAGVFCACLLAVKLKLASLPKRVNWLNMYAVSLLCGIGFTMSLFIGSLAFHGAGTEQVFDERLGIIIGSLISGVAGYLILYMSIDRSEEQAVAPKVAAEPS